MTKQATAFSFSCRSRAYRTRHPMSSNFATDPSVSMISAANRLSVIAILQSAHISDDSMSTGRGGGVWQAPTASRQRSSTFMDMPPIDFFQRWFFGRKTPDDRSRILDGSQYGTAIFG